MPFFPAIFWTIEFYPLVKKVSATTSSSLKVEDNIGVVLCTDGNLLANYDFVLDSVRKKAAKEKSVQYFCAENSKSAMFTFSHHDISSNNVLIICKITIPYDSYIGGTRLDKYQYWLKVLDTQMYCDFVIKVKDKSFNVHKCVLSAHWPYFVTLLESEMSEANSGILTIEDQTPDAIEAMIYYLYTGTSNVTDLILTLELITASDKYNLPDLKAKSLKFAIAKMNEYCVIRALLKAKLHGLDDLFKACINYLEKNTTAIKDLSDYDSLAESEDRFELLALCFDNVRRVKRKLDTSDDDSDENVSDEE